MRSMYSRMALSIAVMACLLAAAAAHSADPNAGATGSTGAVEHDACEREHITYMVRGRDCRVIVLYACGTRYMSSEGDILGRTCLLAAPFSNASGPFDATCPYAYESRKMGST